MLTAIRQETIEDVVLRYSKRGMNILKNHMREDYCREAAGQILELEKGTILLTTCLLYTSWKKLGKVLGMIFAVFAGFASFGIGCATQVNAIANVVEENTGVQGWIVGLVVAILTAIVIFGGRCV